MALRGVELGVVWQRRPAALRAASAARYVYDLGNCWDHTIALERIITDTDTGTRLPHCTGGSGDSPVEDWNEEWATEGNVPPSRPFDQETVNSRLATLP